MSDPSTRQAGPSARPLSSAGDVDMSDVPGEQEHNPPTSESNESQSNSMDFDDDPPHLDGDTSGQPSAPDFSFNFLDDIYPDEDAQFGYWRSSLSPYAEETGIPMEDVFEDRAFVLLNTLNVLESDPRPNFAIYDDQRTRKTDMPLFQGRTMTTVIVPLLAHVQTARKSISVPNADDFLALFGYNDWLDRFDSDECVVRRYAVEYSYEWSVLQEIEAFVEDQENMTLENVDAFALPHNPGYIYVAAAEEELDALDSCISELPLVCPTAELIAADDKASELEFPPAPDAYELYPRDGEWAVVVRGLHVNDYGYVQRFHSSNGTTRPYPVVEVVVIPRVCSACCSNPAAPERIDCVCRVRRPEPLILKRTDVGSTNTTSFEHLFEHSQHPWGIEPLSGLRRLLLPASHIVHSPYIPPSIWVQFFPQLLVFSGRSTFNHPLTPEQLFPLFHTVVVEQDEWISYHCLVVSSSFLEDGATPHDLSFKLIPVDGLPEHHVSSHLVNKIYTSKFTSLSSAVDVGSTVKFRCSTLDDTFSVVKAEDSGRLILRLMGGSESNVLFCIRNVEALLVVDGPVYKRQRQLLAHVPPLFVQMKADEDININSSFHPFSNWHDLRVCVLPVVQPLSDKRLHYKGRQGSVKSVQTTRGWEPSFPSGLIVTVGIDGSTQLVRCDLFDLALAVSANQWSWLSDAKYWELDNTRGFFWTLLGCRPPPDVGILPAEILPTPRTPPFRETRLPESDVPAVSHLDSSFPDPPSPVGPKDTTPPFLDVLRHPHLEGCWIMFSLISPPPSATRKESKGDLHGRIVNVAGVHYIRYQPGRTEDTTKDAPLCSIKSLSPVGTPTQRATMVRRQVRLLDWHSKYFGQAFAIVGADDVSIPFPQRFVYVVQVEALRGTEVMLEAHLFRVLAFKLVPFGDMKDRDGGNQEIFQQYRDHISTLQKRSAHSLIYLNTL
ncbi:hypothetical protein DL96DRAFT_1551040 [Flagelloscypha sp. PMI_526]|nr:hypothetical protein DL96DRAFT_1551040 [Flagelloscypha sp. PMI_526]